LRDLGVYKPLSLVAVLLVSAVQAAYAYLVACVTFWVNVADYLFACGAGIPGFSSFSPFIFNASNSALACLSNPHTDIDLSTNTDCEDMLAFFGDIVEFAEQDKALLVDAAFDAWFGLNCGSVVFVLEVVLLAQIRRKTFSVFLAKFFNA